MKKYLVLAVALAAAPFAASAGELSYSYAEGGAGRANIEIGNGLDDATLTGEFLHGSVELGESFYLFGAYESGSDDGWFGGADIEQTQYQAGVGYHMPLSDRADFLSEISYVNQEAEIDDGFGVFSADANGYRVSAGLRGAFSDHIEGLAKANYTDGSDVDGDFSATVGALVKFSPTWGLVGEVELGSDATKYLVGVRASF